MRFFCLIRNHFYSNTSFIKTNQAMKKINLKIHLLLLLLFTSCIWNDDNTIIQDDFISSYQAVTLQRDVFETSTEVLNPQPIETSGKIYVKDQFLLINEPNKGFHVYDNSDPTNPVNIKFLKVLGSTDIAIKGSVLYINNAVDLIALTFNTDFSDIQITKRVENVFPIMLSPDGFFIQPEANEVIVDWTLIN